MRILLVDDDPDLVGAVSAMLRHHGHTVETAADGAAALRLAASRPEAVLLDLHLPDVDGFEVAQALRAGLLAHEASIIVITGHKAQLEVADRAGVDLLLEKPVDSQHLGGLVEYITKRRHDMLHTAGSAAIRCIRW
ncbi:MAG TPA: response regulator [Kofleriaceae bacterium]|jgi:two-component system KDP operon response regulator KdpE